MGKIEERMAKLQAERVQLAKDPLHGKYVTVAHTAFDHLADKLSELETWVDDQTGLDTWALSQLDPEVRREDPVVQDYEQLVADIKRSARVWRTKLNSLSGKVK